MNLLKKSRSSDGVSTLRIVSVALVLGLLVLAVSQTAKYLYSLKVPKSVTAKIEPSVEKLAAVLGAAKSSVESAGLIGEIFTSDNAAESSTVSASQQEPTAPLFKLAVLSDSHNDSEYLQKALDKVSQLNVDEIVFLGDYTDWGEVSNLEKAKDIMLSSKIPFVSVPGDHDLGETRDESNFQKVFGATYGVLDIAGVKVMYFDNSKNYTVIKPQAMAWFEEEIPDTQYLFLAQPLLTSSMDRVMGIISSVKDEAVFAQNTELLEKVRSSNVRVIISGDLHQFSHIDDSVKNGLSHYTVGALLKSQSLEKLNLQSPRFALLTVYSDSTFELKDISID